MFAISTSAIQWPRVMAVTLMKVNSVDTLQQSMKLESYFQISDPPLWPGVKATKGPCDLIDSPVKRKASNMGSSWGIHEREWVKPAFSQLWKVSGKHRNPLQHLNYSVCSLYEVYRKTAPLTSMSKMWFVHVVGFKKKRKKTSISKGYHFIHILI